MSDFDLNTQPGVMSVLAAIRASALGATEKNELRDLVFLYTNGGGDVSVKIALEQKLQAHKIVPVALSASAPAAPALAFGSYRPTPTFKSPTITVAPPPAAPVAATPAPAQPAAAASVTPTPQPVSPVVPPVSAAPVAVAPAPVAPVPVSPTSAPVSAPTEAAYLERIRQIKTAVNSKVGNPVNLVDIDNQVGREYMNALLEAMKKLSSGAVSEMEPAMSRLETAYAAVEVAIKNHKTAVPPVPEPVVPEAVTAAPFQAEPQGVTTEEPKVVPFVRPVPTPSPAAVVPPIAQMAAVEEPVSGYEMAAQAPEVMPAAAPRPVAPVSAPAAKPEVGGYENLAVGVTPLSDTRRVLTPSDLPEVSAAELSADSDPLNSKLVDDGLHQLLLDWTLFKKSGLFGTGPKGREHPLFKKIADLPVPMLLAGRFDGATQEIRQSITDYMNGWRYEQGIVYQPGETFEKYLRRVIKHILDLQKKQK